MNQITQALANAGVKLPPVKYRIWNWLRDHPEKTVTDIEKGLGLAYPPAQALVEMERGGVLKVYSDMSKKTGPHGMIYKIRRYSVVDKLNYVDTPASSLKKPKATAKVTSYPIAQPEPPKAVPVPTAPQVVTTSNLDNLTIGEARAIYMRLKEMFS